MSRTPRAAEPRTRGLNPARGSPARPERRVEITVSGILVPRWRPRLARFCGLALAEAGCEQWDLSILLCDDQRMAALNERYRGKKGPTDVLSFLRDEPDAGTGALPLASHLVAGDLALSLDTLRRNAAAFDCTEEEELKRLAVHGILHLAGMNHGRGRGRGMLALQERLLRKLEAEQIVGGAKL
jgi:probable rRNA maturation factor